MRLGLIESAWLGTKVGAIEGISLAEEIGFDTYDVFRDPRETSAKLLRQMREALLKNGLKPVAPIPRADAVKMVAPKMIRLPFLLLL